MLKYFNCVLMLKTAENHRASTSGSTFSLGVKTSQSKISKSNKNLKPLIHPMALESGKIDFNYNLKLYFKFLKRYKFIIFILLTLILFIESTTVLDRFLFKIIIDKGTEFSAKNLSLEGFLRIALIIMMVYITASVGKALLKFFHIHYINRLESNLIVDLKRKFFDHLMHMDYAFYTKHKTGSIISKLIRIGGAVERLTDVFIFNFAPLMFQLVVISLSLAYFSWIPALITLLTVSTFVGYGLFMQKTQERSNIEYNSAEDIEKAGIADMLTNIDSIKYFGKENFAKNKFKELSEETKNRVLKFWEYFRWLDAIQALILSTGTFFLVYFTIIGFVNEEYTIGTVVFIYTIFANLIGYLFSFVHGIRNFYRAMADFEMLFRYSKIKNEIVDDKNAKGLKIKRGEIKYKNVTFKYGKREIFHKFNLLIPKNKKTALVGHSGCGKTTLIKLLFRFYDVDSGVILIDKKNIKEFTQESLRNEMSIVPQECILFDDTIYNNIAFSKPGAKKEEVFNAIKFAQLDQIIKNFPNKEHTIVGERGIKLSGGEKQRVSIARALLANKKILVLDEATSSLDSQTEHEIKKDLEHLMTGRTSIIIAHRLSTIMKADKVVVIKKGKIVQQGTHKKLIKMPGEYCNLWNLQKGGYIK